MSRNWRNEFDRTRHEAQIIRIIFESKEGLTFGELLNATRLSKPVLSQHLRRLSSPLVFRGKPFAPVLIQEGIGRSRKYKLHHETIEDIEREGGIVMAYFLPSKGRSRIKAERYLKEHQSGP